MLYVSAITGFFEVGLAPDCAFKFVLLPKLYIRCSLWSTWALSRTYVEKYTYLLKSVIFAECS